MMKYLFNSKSAILGISAVLLLVASGASAETGEIGVQTSATGQVEQKLEVKQETRAAIKVIKQDTASTTKGERIELKQDVKAIRTEAKDTAEEIRKDTREDIKTLRGTAPTTTREVKDGISRLRNDMLKDLEVKRKETKEAIEARREEFKQDMGKRREEAKVNIAEKRKEMKERLQTIKDARKKALIEKLDKQLDDINAKQVEHFGNQLSKAEEVLKRIISRTDKVEAAGSDVSSVRTLITAAETAIASARASVKVQTAKTYVINVTTEAGLRAAVEDARQALRGDIKTVGDTVRAAQLAVRTAATTLIKIPGVEASSATSVTTN